MVVCHFCMEPAEAAVKINCCHLTACRSCVDRDEPRTCPSCLSEITCTDFKVDLELVRFLEAAKSDWRHWKEQACFPEETDRLREVLQCKVCGKFCSKAVSLTCCPSASCRKCALAKLKKDKWRCWNCGLKAASVVTPSQLVNNNLVRAGVQYIVKEGKVCKNTPFIIFLLLQSSQQKPGTDGENLDIDCAQLDQLRIETKKTSKAKAVNVVPPRPKTTQPQMQTNKRILSRSAAEFSTMRVPHTYNGILTVIATVRVPVSASL